VLLVERKKGVPREQHDNNSDDNMMIAIKRASGARAGGVSRFGFPGQGAARERLHMSKLFMFYVIYTGVI
jgi:hypothetical protein